MGAYASNLEFPVGSHLRASVPYSKEKNIEHAGCVFLKYFTVEVILSCFCPECQHNCFCVVVFPAAGISATSEDIPNKIEDLRSECSSDFGGKDSVTSPDGEESGHGRRESHPR